MKYRPKEMNYQPYQTSPHAKPDCKMCKGTGKVRVVVGENEPPKQKVCDCTIASRLIENAERGWTGVTKGEVVKSSPLSSLTETNVYITGDLNWLKAQVRHIAIRKPLTWRYKLITDKEIMASWLATASLAGVDIIDKEAFEITTAKLSIEDLVQPYDLVIFRLGVKAARNTAMPEVLLEALALREHLELPTWVWDQPTRPLHDGHRCWSMAVELELRQWERVRMNGTVRGRSTPIIEDVSSLSTPTPTRKTRTMRTLSSSTTRKK